MQWRMMLVQVIFTWTVHLGTCQPPTSASRTTVPTPPPEIPQFTGRPRNMRNCSIHTDTALPWIVGIWDKEIRGYIGLGSMITYIAFITTCRSFPPSQIGRFKVIAQFIWNTSLPEHPCMQENLISDIYRHPKCAESRQVATFFDFSVMKMEKSFYITGPYYPTMIFATTPYQLLSKIRYINIIPDTDGCILPYFRNSVEQPPVFDFNTYVESIPFYSKCVKLLCERNPPSEDFSKMCQKRFGERAKATMLCMKNKDRSHKDIRLDNNRYWYTGTPLVCNGSSVAIAAQPKIRHHFNEDRDDIHFMVTFLRVWPWLLQQTRIHSVPWARPFYIENMKLTPVRVYSDATVSSPSSLFVTIIALNYFLCVRAQLHRF